VATSTGLKTTSSGDGTTGTIGVVETIVIPSFDVSRVGQVPSFQNDAVCFPVIALPGGEMHKGRSAFEVVLSA
jgi:hypothetical protein